MNEMLQKGYKVDILYIQLADGWYNAVLSEWGKGNETFKLELKVNSVCSVCIKWASLQLLELDAGTCSSKISERGKI